MSDQHSKPNHGDSSAGKSQRATQASATKTSPRLELELSSSSACMTAGVYTRIADCRQLQSLHVDQQRHVDADQLLILMTVSDLLHAYE